MDPTHANVCFRTNVLLIYFAGLFLFFVVSIFITYHFAISQQKPIPIIISNPASSGNTTSVITERPVGDPLTNYDYNSLYNPLKEPARRVPRYQIPNIDIDFPTRGYPDNFTQFGTLVNNEAPKEQRILRLFGREIYPGANKYEYYTMINSGLDQIKIPLYGTKRRDELYQDDEVFVKELDLKYRVHLYRFDAPRYYP